MNEPVVRNDCEAQREGPEPRRNQDEPVHELGHVAFRRSYVEDEEGQRHREDPVANPFRPVGSIHPSGLWSFLVRRTVAPHGILPAIAFLIRRSALVRESPSPARAVGVIRSQVTPASVRPWVASLPGPPNATIPRH